MDFRKKIPCLAEAEKEILSKGPGFYLDSKTGKRKKKDFDRFPWTGEEEFG